MFRLKNIFIANSYLYGNCRWNTARINLKSVDLHRTTYESETSLCARPTFKMCSKLNLPNQFINLFTLSLILHQLRPLWRSCIAGCLCSCVRRHRGVCVTACSILSQIESIHHLRTTTTPLPRARPAATDRLIDLSWQETSRFHRRQLSDLLPRQTALLFITRSALNSQRRVA